MSKYQYNKVTPEMIEKFKEIAPKRVLVGDEINEDFTHDEMAIYGKARPEVLVEATSTEEVKEDEAAMKEQAAEEVKEQAEENEKEDVIKEDTVKEETK